MGLPSGVLSGFGTDPFEPPESGKSIKIGLSIFIIRVVPEGRGLLPRRPLRVTDNLPANGELVALKALAELNASHLCFRTNPLMVIVTDGCLREDVLAQNKHTDGL